MSNKVKRNSRIVTVSQKIEAVKRVDTGQSKASVARDLGVHESTLRGWCKNEKLRFMSCTASFSSGIDSSDESACKRLRAESTLDLKMRPSKRVCIDWPRTPLNSNKDLGPATCSAVAPNFFFGTDSSASMSTNMPVMSSSNWVPSLPILLSYYANLATTYNDIYTNSWFLTHMNLFMAQYGNHTGSLDLRNRDTYRKITFDQFLRLIKSNIEVVSAVSLQQAKTVEESAPTSIRPQLNKGIQEISPTSNFQTSEVVVRELAVSPGKPQPSKKIESMAAGYTRMLKPLKCQNEKSINKESATVKSTKPLKKGEKLQMALEKIYDRNAMKADRALGLRLNK